MNQNLKHFTDYSDCTEKNRDRHFEPRRRDLQKQAETRGEKSHAN
jgi:hypothetical protein